MTAGKAIGKVMYEMHVNQEKLASMSGMHGQSTVSESLRRDMKVSTFIKFANALGYKVYLRRDHPMEFLARKNEIEITVNDEDGETDG